MAELTVVISATGTEVGKTWLGAQLARGLRAAGIPVAARKPVQSYDPGDATTDADILAGATGEDPITVCPEHRRFAIPMAPPMAADYLGKSSFTVKQLVAEISVPDEGVALIEGIGGPRSPLALDGDTVDLADQLSADAVVLVADSNLGAINAVLLSAAAFSPRRLAVFLNHFDASDDLHAENHRWLRDQSSLDIFTSPGELTAHLMQMMKQEAG